MPSLATLQGSGVRAELRTIIPALTPPAWTSLATGRSPGWHGIFDFFGKDQAQGHHIRLLTSRDIGCETLWSMANRHGVRATVLNFPLTFPAPAIDGHIVPGGWMPWRQLRLGCHPSDLYEKIKVLDGFNPREIAMDMAHEEKALEGCKREEFQPWIELHIRREKLWFRVLEFLMREEPSGLTSVLFDGVDKIQHLCWRFLDPALASRLSEPWEFQVRDSCRNYFREIDRIIGRLVESAGPEATILIASDHGFGAQVRTFFVNSWLQRQGYLTWVDGGPKAEEGEVLGMARLGRHSFLLDWTRTKAYAPMPSGNGIHVVKQDEQHPGGVPPGEYDAFCERLRQQLLSLHDPETGKPLVSQVWRREQVFQGPRLDVAPDLTLVLEDGGLISILASEQDVMQRPSPTGAHRPEGVFVACGPGILRGKTLPAISILDVAPLILYSLGLPVPASLEGRVPEEALEPEAFRSTPVRQEGSQEPKSQSVSEPTMVLDPEAEAEILKRLQALGYVE